jgi:hypothetical protein
MAQDPKLPEGHITLKEAARISGYAPDYIGQLIRKGKLYGRQIYYNVAWVTTEAALREYIAADKEGGRDKKEGVGERIQRAQNLLLSEARLTGILKILLYCSLAFAICLALVLFYVLSVNIDRSLEEQAAERALQHVESR